MPASTGSPPRRGPDAALTNNQFRRQNLRCEALPVDRGKGFLHRRMIPLLGMAIGEFWWLAELSEHCAATGNFDFLLVSAALRLPRGVGSPANAFALT